MKVPLVVSSILLTIFISDKWKDSSAQSPQKPAIVPTQNLPQPSQMPTTSSIQNPDDRAFEDLINLTPRPLTPHELKALGYIKDFLNNYTDGVFDYSSLKHMVPDLARDQDAIHQKGIELKNLGGPINRVKGNALEKSPYNRRRVQNKITIGAAKEANNQLTIGLKALGVDPKTANREVDPEFNPKKSDSQKVKDFFYCLELIGKRSNDNLRKFLKKEDQDVIIKFEFRKGISIKMPEEILAGGLPDEVSILLIRNRKVVEVID